MKVLWITNIPFSHHNELLKREGGPLASGAWLYAAFESSSVCGDIDLHIVTVSEIGETISGKFENCTFHVLPGGNMRDYDMESEINLQHWNRLRNSIDPDIVLLWGTESRFAYTATKAFQGKRIVVFIQGVLHSICDHYFDGIPYQYRCCTLRDFIGYTTAQDSYPILKKNVAIEKYILSNAYGVVVENNWCEAQCISINPQLHVYRCQLPIKSVFYKKKWNLATSERYSLFTNGGGSTFKGHHILFQALAIIKKEYPNVKCYIPGPNYIKQKDNIRRRTGYFKWLIKLYKEHRLSDNIIFAGILNSEQMANYIASKHIFVMPSTVENHSSSLIEAMIVGAPCVSSLVGGTADLIQSGENGILYNSLEATTLAGSIIKLFTDDELTTKIALGARISSNNRNRDFGGAILNIYNQVIEGK